MVGTGRHDPNVDRCGLVYAFALPFFDGYRPAILEEPLHKFYAEINFVARYCWRALPSIDAARAKQYVLAYIERTGAKLHRTNSRPAR
jgi:hypothetical protein